MKIDRVGEKGVNNFGSEMVIVEYRKYSDVDIYFPEYDWTAKNVQCNKFKNGNIKCPYEKRLFNRGYLGEGNYKVKENGKFTNCYNTWSHMLQRCYYEKFHEKYPTYKDCKADENWLNFQNFGEWFDNNYYEVDNEKMCLDKDILVKHNKIYSPDTCVFVPETINNLFVKNDRKRGKSAIGTCYHKRMKKYQVNCWLINPQTGKSKNEYLGYYDTEIEAFQVYKYYKEKNIKEVADYYKKQIPHRLYDGMCNYEVEITD